MLPVIKKYSLLIYISIATILFVARIVNFAGQYGGVEHDSGWYMGVARNLAERGIYASYTNTIVQEGTGAYPSIHGRFSVQDKDGFIYFPAGVTVGPGYVVPEALILKVFGNGWWQYRAWPLLSFAGLLVLLFYLVYAAAGLIALLLLQLWLWAIPQLYITYAFEAFSEHTAMFYLLLSFFLLYRAITSRHQFLFIFLSGLFLSFSFLTKTLYALTAAGFGLVFLIQLYYPRRQLKLFFARILLFIFGLFLPIVSFEVYQYLAVMPQFGSIGLEAIKKDASLTFQTVGSGINNLNLTNLDWDFVGKKSTVWAEIGLANPLLVWVFMVISPFFMLVKIFRRSWPISGLFYGAAVVSLSWFVLISPFGWTRHAWQGLPLMMSLICIVFGMIFSRLIRVQLQNIILIFFLTILLILQFRPDKFDPNPTFNHVDIDYWRQTRYQRDLQGLPSSPIFSLNDQQQTINYFSQNIKPQDRIYYLQGLLVAEMPPLVDKVFYPYDRYVNNNYQNPDGGKSYLIFGPYQMGPESFYSSEYLPTNIQQYCQNVVFANSSYLLCLLKQSTNL